MTNLYKLYFLFTQSFLHFRFDLKIKQQQQSYYDTKEITQRNVIIKWMKKKDLFFFIVVCFKQLQGFHCFTKAQQKKHLSWKRPVIHLCKKECIIYHHSYINCWFSRYIFLKFLKKGLVICQFTIENKTDGRFSFFLFLL